MKKLVPMFVVSMLVSLSAFAGHVKMDSNDSHYLASCGGRVSTSTIGGQLNISFEGVENCSTVVATGVTGQEVNAELQGSERSRSGSITISKRMLGYGENTIRVELASRSGAHSDSIEVRVYGEGRPAPMPAPMPIPAPRPGRGGEHGVTRISANGYSALGACGGYLETNTKGGQLNLVFRGVENCSNFDIVTTNGARVNYPNKKLQGMNSDRSGSFTIPRSMIEFGYNTIRVLLKSNSGETAETILVDCAAW